MKYDYIVIGGGIIGMTTAREIAIRGASVAVLDRQLFGNEASRAAGGILSPMRPWIENRDSIVLSEQAKKIYPDFISELNNETGVDAELINSGLIIIDKDHSQETRNWAYKNKIHVIEKINVNQIKINIPEHSILLPEVFQVRPPLLLEALYKSLKKLSVKLFENSQISHIGLNDNKFEYINLSNDEKLFADNLIFTTGAWSRLLLNNINKDIDIKPIRGQMICIRSNNPVIDKIILDGAYYLIPRLDGNMLIGSTMEDAGFDKTITEITKNRLLDWGYSIIPELVDAEFIAHWAGLRPATTDGKPIIGAVSNFKNIYVNTGHFRKGILQAPSSAKLLTDYLFNTPSFMDINSFSLQRSNDTKKLA